MYGDVFFLRTRKARSVVAAAATIVWFVALLRIGSDGGDERRSCVCCTSGCRRLPLPTTTTTTIAAVSISMVLEIKEL